MTTDNWTIQHITGEMCRKLCRIWIGADGSYYVAAPYHSARRASIMVSTAYYERRRSTMTTESQVTVGLLDDDHRRLKLSHHPDGFAQFSGEGIVSGRYENGDPKGIGIMSFPLSDPPRTGGSFACAILGLEEYEIGNPTKVGAVNFYDTNIPPLGGAKGYVLEGSYFTADWRQYLINRDGDWYLEMQHSMNAIIRYKALLSTSPSQCFIGLRLHRSDVRMSDAVSGFILSGPSSNVRTIDGERMADGLFCLFPAKENDTDAARRLEHMTETPDYDSIGLSPDQSS